MLSSLRPLAPEGANAICSEPAAIDVTLGRATASAAAAVGAGRDGTGAPDRAAVAAGRPDHAAVGRDAQRCCGSIITQAGCQSDPLTVLSRPLGMLSARDGRRVTSTPDGHLAAAVLPDAAFAAVLRSRVERSAGRHAGCNTSSRPRTSPAVSSKPIFLDCCSAVCQRGSSPWRRSSSS